MTTFPGPFLRPPARRLLAVVVGILAPLAMLMPTPSHAGLPDEPRVIDDIPEIGTPGGELRMLIGSAKDTRLLFVYGYARLMGYDKNYALQPDILKAVDVAEGRVFTLHLRKGHRWSDGEPFTSEDFRFYWEDVANNATLMPVGPDISMLVDGESPKVEFPDDLTVRYTWSKPNPFFLPALASATPVFIYRPAHYLRQFHEKYADPAFLADQIKSTKSRDWGELFGRKDRMNKFDNPDLPTLEPWMLRTAPPAERFVAERNPYFHRVDTKGQQLPYLDRYILNVIDNKLVPIKTGAGETDIQARGLFFKDYTFLKDSEKRSGLATRLWTEARGAHLAIYPNLNAADAVWRDLFRDVRFRRALSLAVDRDGIGQYMYFGLSVPANNTVLPASPLYTEAVGTAWMQFDIDAANKLLDEIGLARGPDGTRKLPDGRSLELVVETAGEDSEQADVLELVRDTWAQIGFKIHTKPLQREVLRNRIFSGESLMTIWWGNENGLVTPEMAPTDFTPVRQDQSQWPKWGQFYETKGKAGEKPDTADGARLMELWEAWSVATDDAARKAAWDEILNIFSDQVYTIGLIAEVKQPVAVRAGLHNVPEEAVWNWEPGAQFGIYRPDTWWRSK